MNTTKTNTKLMERESIRFCVKYDGNNVEYIDVPKKYVSCADIWMCKFPDAGGSVQSGFRPAFILSNNKNNRFSTTVNVLPITSKLDKRSLPCHVNIKDYERCGLNSPSTIMVEQVTTVPTASLRNKIGEIKDTETLEDICVAMCSQFPIMKFNK